jgi:aminoglycoside 3-N-acetyltransferase I
MSYSYKQLTSGDILLFKELLRVFGEAFEEISTYQDAIPSDTYLKSLLGKNYFIALVGQDGSSVGRACGVCFGKI